MSEYDIQKLIEQNDLIIQQNADILEKLHEDNYDRRLTELENKTDNMWSDLARTLMFLMLLAIFAALVYFVFNYFADWNSAIDNMNQLVQSINNMMDYIR